MTKGRRRLAIALSFALLAALGGLHAPPARAQVGLATPLNNVASSLAAPHAAGSGTLDLKSGEGGLFGTPTPSAPVRVTVARKNTLVNNQIVQGSAYTIFLCTGRTGDQLTGCTAVEGTADRIYAKNDPVVVAITAGTILDLQGAIATLPVDSSVVHKAVAETITGAKTFAGGVVHSDTVTVNQAGGTAAGIVLNLNGNVPSAIDINNVSNTGRPIRFMTDGAGIGLAPGVMVPRSYFTEAGAYATQLGVTISGAFSGTTAADFVVRRPSLIDPTMLDIWSDVNGPALLIRNSLGGTGAGAYALAIADSGLEAAASIRFIVYEDGKMGWGAAGITDLTARAGGIPIMDTFLYRGSSGVIQIDRSLKVGTFGITDGGANNYSLGGGSSNITTMDSAAWWVRTANGATVTAYYDNAAGRVAFGNTNPLARMHVKNANASIPALIVEGAPSQGGNLIEARADGGTVLASLSASGFLTLPGVAFTEANSAGDGLDPIVTYGDASPSVAVEFRRKIASGTFFYGQNTDTGGYTFKGTGPFTISGTVAGGAETVFLSNTAGGGTANSARLALAPQSGFGSTSAPYIEAFNVGASDGGIRLGTYNGAVDQLATRMWLNSEGNLGLGGFSFGGGRQVMFIANAAVVPTANPTGGGVMYAEGGALKWRSPAGTVTTVAPNLVLPLVLWGLRRRFGRLAA